MKDHNLAVYFEAPVAVLDEVQITTLVSKMIADHKIEKSEITIVFVDNAYISKLNLEYFNKPYPTDVISFPLSETGAICLEGEVYIGTEVAREQAAEFNVSLQNELLRLVIHGVLHLLNYDDLTAPAKAMMTEREDFYLHFIFGDDESLC
jgi:rRNA maturation RNase YbeY